MSNEDPFLSYLGALGNESSGKLAAFRRACGQRLSESRNCQDFVAISARPADFLTVTLVAQYPTDNIRNGRHQHAYPNKGSIGAAWARYCRERDPEQDPVTFYCKRQEALVKGQDLPRSPSIHERFRTLLDSDIELDGAGELAHRLRGVLRMLVADEVPIDIFQLARDMRGWRSESRYVQKCWAKAFYGSPVGAKEETTESDAHENGQEEPEENPEQEESNNAD